MDNQGDQWRPFEPSKEGVAQGALELAAAACRRCSECVGQEHHWLDNFRCVDETDPYFICKHCDAACDEVDPEEGSPEPSGELVAQPPICESCDHYAKDCECDLGGVEPDCPACLRPDSDCDCRGLLDRCIADDSTECNCSRCVDDEDRFWSERGEGGGS
jgi:hypothetical protein